ncbi:MAG TPA: cytosine permease [Actinomycetes bacterium]|nr:cytosine permease [Actinomycetes bacterium]
MAQETLTTGSAPSLTTIETRSIDYVPESERHGRLALQGPFWFLGNFQPFTVAIGFVGPLVGLTLGWTVLAATLGILFGTIFMAAHASQGPKLGLPQMIQSRAQFGYRGVVLPLLATGFTFLAFNVVDTIIIKEGLKGIFGWNATATAAVITVVSALLAIYGHDWLHRVFQVLFFVSLPFWIVLTLGIITGNAGGKAPASGLGFTWAGFLAMFTVAASYNITYAPYVSDYSRYLPRNTPTGKIMFSVFWGAAGSPIWLIPIGAWMATRLGTGDALVGIHDAGNNVVGGLGSLLAILAVLALVATMGLNAYSGMLTVVTGVDAFRPVNPTRRLRVAVIVVLAVIWIVLGIALVHATTALNNSLLAMLYLLAPWTAINLVDFFFLRHGRYAITDLFRPNGIYGLWSARGVTAYLVAVLVEIPFAYIPGFYESIGAKTFNGVDISWILGMIVAAGVYLVMSRGHDVHDEEPAIERSEQVLAETGTAR